MCSCTSPSVQTPSFHGQHQRGCQQPVAHLTPVLRGCSALFRRRWQWIPLLQPHPDQTSPCCLWGIALTDWCSVWPGFTLWISVAPKSLREVCVSTDSAWSSVSMYLHLSLSLSLPALRCCETKYDRANYNPNCEYINFSMVISNIVLISDFCI